MSGLKSQLSVAKEGSSAYGTFVVPNRHFEHRSNGIKLTKEFLRSQQLKAGRQFQTASRRIATTREGGGPVSLEVPNKGFGVFLDQLHGNTVTPVQQASTTAYLQTHDIGTTDPLNKSLTVQTGKPTVEGVVEPFTMLGTKVLSASFRCGIGEWLTCDLNLDSQDVVTDETLATFSPPSNLRSFAFTQGVVLIDGVSAGVVKSIEIPINFSYATDRWSLGAQTKQRPLLNGYPSIDPRVSVEFKDLTLRNKFLSGAVASLGVTFTGPQIAGAYNEQIAFTMAAVGINDADPSVDGPGLLMQDLPLEVLDNGTNAPLRVTYQSTETTL
jgi:hypothetical protein